MPLVQLIDAAGAPYDFVAAGDPRTYADLTTPAGLREIATYADGIGANKELVLPRDPATGATGEPSDLVDDAHAEGLLVHVWTLRAENQFMATNFRSGTDPNAHGDLRAEVAGVPRRRRRRDVQRQPGHRGRRARGVAGARRGVLRASAFTG